MTSTAFMKEWERKHGRNYAVAHKYGRSSPSRKRGQSRKYYRGKWKDQFADHLVSWKLVQIYGY